jgi:outer membrane immunogenic protein
MRSFNRIVFALGLSTVPVAVSALPFVPNVYLGVEAGQGTRDTPAIGKKDKGLDYGGYAGVELPSMPFGYLAVEANAGASGGKTSSVTGSSSAAVGTKRDAKWNWSGTARAGVNIIPGLAVYGLAGYGEENADVRVTLLGPGTSTKSSRSFSGLVYGAGARFTVKDGFGIRAEYRKLTTDGDYDPAKLMAGVYYRF